MMQAATGEPPVVDVRVVEELLRTLVKGQRALQMYLPNNPVYQRTLQQVADAFGPVWDVTGQLVLDVQEDQIAWEGAVVFRHGEKGEGLAWQLYKDGLRRLTLLPGVEATEVYDLLRVVNRARTLPTDSTDDLLTLLWEQEFALVSYTFVEVGGDGVEFSFERQPVAAATGSPSPDARAEVQSGRLASDGMLTANGSGQGVVDMADFDATLYFLDESEIRYVQSGLEAEYRRDIRESAIDALLDILETQRDPAIRLEVISLFDELLPAQLATGGFRAVARILRELRAIAARTPGLDPSLQGAVLSFEERLSSPEILQQLLRVLCESAAHPTEDDIGEVLRELRPQSLPVVLVELERIADPVARRTLQSSVDAIARTDPDAIAALIETGPTDVIAPSIALAARLGLSPVVPAIIGHLHAGDAALRLVAVRALGELGTPGAVAALESALGDPERSVRQGALSALLARGGSGGLQARLEAMLFTNDGGDRDRTERRMLFEAYGSCAGAAAIPRLRELFEPRGIFRRRPGAEILAAALFALAKVATPEARVLVERVATDREPVLRSAASAALREWPG